MCLCDIVARQDLDRYLAVYLRYFAVLAVYHQYRLVVMPCHADIPRFSSTFGVDVLIVDPRWSCSLVDTVMNLKGAQRRPLFGDRPGRAVSRCR